MEKKNQQSLKAVELERGEEGRTREKAVARNPFWLRF